MFAGTEVKGGLQTSFPFSLEGIDLILDMLDLLLVPYPIICIGNQVLRGLEVLQLFCQVSDGANGNDWGFISTFSFDGGEGRSQLSKFAICFINLTVDFLVLVIHVLELLVGCEQLFIVFLGTLGGEVILSLVVHSIAAFVEGIRSSVTCKRAGHTITHDIVS